MKFLSSCSEGAASHQHRGLGWSLGDSSCWKRSVLLVLHFVKQNIVFSRWTYLKILKKWTRKGNICAWSEDCILVQVRILPVKLNILQIGHLTPACVHVLCPHTWKHFIPHLLCPLLVWLNWNSRYIFVEKVLSVAQ